MHTHFHNGATIIIVAIAMYNIYYIHDYSYNIVAIAMYNIYYIHGYSYNIVAIAMYNIYMVIATINSQYAQTITISVMYSKVRTGEGLYT